MLQEAQIFCLLFTCCFFRWALVRRLPVVRALATRTMTWCGKLSEHNFLSVKRYRTSCLFVLLLLLGQAYQLIKGSTEEQGVDRDSINQQVCLVKYFLLALTRVIWYKLGQQHISSRGRCFLSYWISSLWLDIFLHIYYFFPFHNKVLDSSFKGEDEDVEAGDGLCLGLPLLRRTHLLHH